MADMSPLLARIRAAMATASIPRTGIGLGEGQAASARIRSLLRPEAEDALRRVQDAISDHGLYVHDGPVGAGGTSLVFDVRPAAGGPDRHVLKLAAPLHESDTVEPFDLPDVPGVAPYWINGSEGPVKYGVQPRAAAVLDEFKDNPRTAFWWDRAQDLSDNLRARGWTWIDNHAANLGIMPDKTMAVIDGRLYQYDQTPGFIAKWSDWKTPEDAIRALRYDGPIP